jgi:HD-like signal output (HDOD) protein/CheY-like chemotaxis protein
MHTSFADRDRGRPQRRSAASSGDGASTSLEGRDALVVEDDSSAVEIAEGLLGVLGYRVRSATDGRAGLLEVGRKMPDLILLDVCLPEMDGPTFLKVLRNVDGARGVSVVAVSAVYPRDGAVARQLHDLGAVRYLEKPFTLAQLRTAVAEAHPAGPAARAGGGVDKSRFDLGIPCWTLTVDGRRELVLETVGADEVAVVAPRGVFRRGRACKLEAVVVRPAGKTRVRMLAEAVRQEGDRGGGERWTLAVQAVSPNGGLAMLRDGGVEAVRAPQPEPTARVQRDSGDAPRDARPASAPRPRRRSADTRRGADREPGFRAATHEIDPDSGLELDGFGEPRERFDQELALFLRTIRKGRFKLPLMPGTVREAIDLTHNPTSSFIGLSTVIEKDPPLTAQLLRLANSPAFAGREATGGLRMALTRIGLRGIREVLLLASVSDILVVPGDRRLTQRLQERAVGVALGCNGIAHRLGLDDDAAFTAGVLHDVGWPIAYGLTRELRSHLPADLASDPARQRLLAERLHGPLGLELATRWGLPDATAQAIGHHHAPAEAPTEPTLAWCVQAARTALDRAGLHPEDRMASMVGCEGFQVLGLTAADVDKIVGDLKHRLGLPIG